MDHISGAQGEVSQQVIATGDCGHQVDQVVGELYQLAALLLGDQDAAVMVVEESLASVLVDPCADEQQAMREARSSVVEHALARMEADRPGVLRATASSGSVCGEWEAVEQDPIAATVDAGAAQTDHMRVQMEQAVRKPQTRQMRKWLEALAPATRAVFVLRGLLRYDDKIAADLLSRGGVSNMWTAREVKRTYQDALCALSSLLMAQPLTAGQTA